MAISTYSELKTAVAAWLNKTNLTSVIPDFIKLAEADIRRDLRVPAMESLATGTLTGVTLAHPSLYVLSKRLVVDDYVYLYVTPEEYQAATRANSTRKIFTSIGTNFYILGGTSGASYTLIYTAGFTALAGDSDTNWVLTNAPDVYLAGACRHGSVYLKDVEAEQRWATKYSAAVGRENMIGTAVASPGPLMVRTA